MLPEPPVNPKEPDGPSHPEWWNPEDYDEEEED